MPSHAAPRRFGAPKSCLSVFVVFLSATGTISPANSLTADDREAADLLPESVVAYAEVPRLGKAVELVLNHPLRQSIESMPVVKAVLASADMRPLRDGLSAFEGGMGKSWIEAIDLVTDGGVHFAVDGPSEGAALLIRSSSKEQLEKLQSLVLALSQFSQGDFGIAKQTEYRGFKAYAMGDNIRMALMDQWYLLTNKSDLGRSIIDRYLDGGDDALSDSKRFTTAMKLTDTATDANYAAKAYIDIETIRGAGLAPQLYAAKTENIAAEAVFGGISSNLTKTPSAIATLALKQSGITFRIATPHEKEWGVGREYFFGEDGQNTAPPLLDVSDRLFAMSTHRDLSQMWLRAPDLMTDKANEELAQADAGLTTFFSGLDFGEDVLGSLTPKIQFVACQQSFDKSKPIPAIKLPAFALRFRMQEPEVATSEFRRVFQNFVGFANVVGAMQGQPQLDLDFEQSGNIKMVTATYVPPRDEDDLESIPINFNFSPTIAFEGDRMILSSTTELARQIAESSGPDNASGSANTTTVLSADRLADVLQDNRSQLEAQNMLEKGHSPVQAQAEIGLILDIVRMFDSFSMDLDVDDRQLALTAELKVQAE